MDAIVKPYNFVLQALAVCSGIAIFSAFVMIVIDVSMRVLGFSPPAFTIAVVEYILLYFTMLAAPWLARIKGHVFIDAVTQFLPPTVKQITARIAYLICICAALTFCWFSSGLLLDAWDTGTVDVRGVDMPQWALYLPMPLCFLMLAIEFLRYFVGIDDMYATALVERDSM